jgi:effector-binding domain-containing protein
MTMPYQSNNAYSIDEMRMDVLAPDGSTAMAMVFGEKNCWSKTGPVVVPCAEKNKQTYTNMVTINQAFLLFPLKSADWKLSLSKEKVKNMDYQVLNVKHIKKNVEGKLYINPESYHVNMIAYQGHLGPQKGRFMTTVGSYQDHCGIKMPMHFETTFNNQPYMHEEVVKVGCAAVDNKVFAQPTQVKDGTIVEKTNEAMTLACTQMKGPYDQTGQTIGKLMGLMNKQEIMPMGASTNIYHDAPPKVKDPKNFLTDVCFPVVVPEKKQEIKGDLFFKKLGTEKVLSVYGIGDYSKKSGEMADKLMQEIKKRKLSISGPMRQVSYMDPQKHAKDSLVSEIQIPVKSAK